MLGYVCCTDDVELGLLQAEIKQVQALAGKALATLFIVETKALPTGCAVFAVSSSTTVYVEVSTHVEISSLVDHTQAKLLKATEAATRQRKLIEEETWSSQVSDAVKEMEQQKLSVAEAQVKSLSSSIEQFKKLSMG